MYFTALFQTVGIALVGNHEPYTPHITLMKLSRPFQREHSMEAINNMYYNDFKDMSLGSQQLAGVRYELSSTILKNTEGMHRILTITNKPPPP